ncbi:unnamed protein product [Owenia fusiformis]|uniref:Peroxisomal trans-2-enoyl-CoA reductase n=1 Tax=Owenia fusiformis TaxID=6347 RepID=A0A8J1TQ71_OWEFU|nr:unnamed protein product [Owenia fusiformis]
MAAGARMAKVSSVLRNGLFNDKIAIVTGGATGIGKAITEELLHLGCKVVIASRNEEKIIKAAAEMTSRIPKSSPAEVLPIQCNIRKEEQVQNLISKTVEKYGKLDFLVNNGGGQFPSPAADIKLKGWNAVVETNLTGTFLMCKEAYNQWMKDNGGAIVNIIADMWKGFPLMSHTGAARAAVDNITKSLSIEWAESGVRINSVAPGSSIYSETAAANYGDATIFEAAIPYIPAQRLGKTEEISGMVCFLLSPASSFITGETVKIDGGASLYGTHTWRISKHDKMPAYTWEKDIEAQEANDNKSKL